MENLQNIVKAVLGLAGLGVIAFALYYMTEGQYKYEGADDPDYYYPDAVREEAMEKCTTSFRQFSKFDNITQTDLDTLCSCYLESLEDAYSFKEYDGSIRRRLMEFQGTPRERLIHRCAEENGLRIF